MTLALDTSYPRVLIDFFNDPHGFRWHARLLVVADGSGRWIGATPDCDIELDDLTTHRVRPLERASAYPSDIVEETYGFDELDEAGVADFARLCHGLARVLGFVRQVEPEDDGHWRVADVASASFGEVVPEGAISDQATFVSRGRSGLVLLDDSWCLAEFVPTAREAQWRLRGALSGQDFRVIALSRDGQGRRFISAGDTLGRYLDEGQKEWPFKGPRVVMEFMRSLRDGGLKLKMHHQEWFQKSGVHGGGAVARQHHTICTALRFMQSFDQYDLSMGAYAEYKVRALVHREAVARRNPKAPDFTGSEVMMEAHADAPGAAITAGFDQWVMEQQRSRAQIAKQGRLMREEAELERRSTTRRPKGLARGASRPPRGPVLSPAGIQRETATDAWAALQETSEYVAALGSLEFSLLKTTEISFRLLWFRSIR